MDEVEELIKGVNLPITLPEGSIIVMGKRRIPNFDLILEQFPAPLRLYVNPNATAPGGGVDGYLLPLNDGRYLKIKLNGNEVVELAVLGN